MAHELHMDTRALKSVRALFSTGFKIRIPRFNALNVRIAITCVLALSSGWLLSGLLRQNSWSHQSLASAQNVQNYFSSFKGFAECNIRLNDLYVSPSRDQHGFHAPNVFCHDRKRLLEALSGGGRVGFDAPYQSRGCSSRWLDVEDICFILERFDGLVFVGDEGLRTVYGGLNILLRRDLAHGTLNLASMDDTLKGQCRCENQYIKQDCRQHYLLDSAKADQDDHTGAIYFCNRVRHAFLSPDTALLSQSNIERLKQLIPRAPKSNFKPVPIICSLGTASTSLLDARESLKKIVELADESERNTPILWIGPTAAGHIELKNRKGNQEIWQFDRSMADAATELDVEVLGMWNLTAQATSWDGMRFGEGVAITQAMMVMNWLSRLESS